MREILFEGKRTDNNDGITPNYCGRNENESRHF